ncbi:MAG: hypothetical protein HYR56_13915 [Acidobacteria bacterium]|nr:hypothetical protein [Acidobacteriota bacterium]MBI3425267.1 hypothetical protein [Acidobacteriota bacterium]
MGWVALSLKLSSPKLLTDEWSRRRLRAQTDQARSEPDLFAQDSSDRQWTRLRRQ